MNTNIGFLIEEHIWGDDEKRILSALAKRKIPFVIYSEYEEDKSTWSAACFNSTHSRCKAKIKSIRTGVICTCPCHSQ